MFAMIVRLVARITTRTYRTRLGRHNDQFLLMHAFLSDVASRIIFTFIAVFYFD